MSLQLLAKQMEAKGRNGDSVLVHMTPGEVEGLQKLAESAGGSLSVNPETGLVEANFLKRMLPTLVGIGVGAFAGPVAGAAAGAAVGGYQAKRNDQDVGMGMLMGGLGGYGGAGIGAGLGAAGSTAAQATAMGTEAARQGVQQAAAQTAQQAAMSQGAQLAGAEAAQTTAQQLAAEKLAQEAAADMARREAGALAINQAGETAAKDFASQGFTARAGQGIQALAGQPGRDAFLGQVGMKTAGMAAAPLMSPGKAPGEAPVDDEMIVYDYDVGRTGAELTPTSSSAERKYFDGRYSPARRIPARDYPYAEGGEVADDGVAGGMTGASKAAFDYLMGNAASSAPAGGIANLAARATPGVGSDNMYAFDPVTGTFLRNPNVAGAATSGSRVGTSFADSGGGGYEPIGPNPDFDTPEKQAAFYADPKNAAFADFTRAGQKALSYTPMSLFASAVAPEYMAERALNAEQITYGISAPPSAGSGYSLNNNAETGEGGGYASDYGTTSYGGEQYGDMPAGTYAGGGLMGLAKGGMKSGGFVVPADVVSMIGEGNTDAGYSRIKSMIPGSTAIKGKDGGQADTVKTSIEGKQPARVAHGEMYIPPETVKRMGGAKKLYAMMDRVRQQATGSKKQIKPVSLKRAMA